MPFRLPRGTRRYVYYQFGILLAFALLTLLNEAVDSSHYLFGTRPRLCGRGRWLSKWSSSGSCWLWRLASSSGCGARCGHWRGSSRSARGARRSASSATGSRSRATCGSTRWRSSATGSVRSVWGSSTPSSRLTTDFPQRTERPSHARASNRRDAPARARRARGAGLRKNSGKSSHTWRCSRRRMTRRYCRVSARRERACRAAGQCRSGCCQGEARERPSPARAREGGCRRQAYGTTVCSAGHSRAAL